MTGIPDNVVAEIAEKRDPSSVVVTPTETKDDQPNGDEPKKDETPAADKPKTNGQSIAQVAAAANDDDVDDSGDDDGSDGDPKDESKPKRQSIMKELIQSRKEMKELKRMNREQSLHNMDMTKALEKVVTLVESMKASTPEAKQDILDTFAEKWDLEPEGVQEMYESFAKKLGITKPQETDTKPKEPEKVEPTNDTRRIEIAIENEYDDFVDSYPQIEGKINIKAIKMYILSDKENLTKSFEQVVKEVYPGVLEKHTATLDGADTVVNTADEKPDWNDEKVQARVSKDPKLQKQYADDLEKRVRSLYM